MQFGTCARATRRTSDKELKINFPAFIPSGGAGGAGNPAGGGGGTGAVIGLPNGGFIICGSGGGAGGGIGGGQGGNGGGGSRHLLPSTTARRYTLSKADWLRRCTAYSCRPLPTMA
jgi:hypothetical protein